MLAARHRMRRREDFAATLRGRRAGARTLAVAVHRLGVADPEGRADTARAPQPIVGFVVSKAVGGATTRNLVRRRLRNAARPLVSSLEPGSGLVVRALPAAATASYAELSRDLEKAVRRVARPVERPVERPVARQ